MVITLKYHVERISLRESKDGPPSAAENLRLRARNCKLSESAATRVEGLAAHKTGRNQFEKTAWLFRSLQGELLRDKELEQHIKLVLAHSRSKFAFADDLNFEEICLHSPTKWNLYIKRLTPELRPWHTLSPKVC